MNARQETTTGDVWEIGPGEREPVVWSFDPRDGVVQGPLDLRSFADASLLLQLRAGQTALLVQDGAPRRVWLEGAHLLPVGSQPAAIPPEARLFMLDTRSVLACRWGEVSPLRLPGGTTARGSCAFRIVAPSCFYEAFLQHAETAGEGFVRRLLGALVQARLETRLVAAADADEALRLLASLGPVDLAAGWEEFGVQCVAFAPDGFARAPAPRPAEVTASALGS